MTVLELLDILNSIDDKSMPVTKYEHDYGNYSDINKVGIKNVPNDEFYLYDGQRILVIY